MLTIRDEQGVRALRVVVDAESVQRSEMGSVTAGIWLDYEGACFPERGWSDFVVILAWWEAELRALPARDNPRATASLDFMDGPYRVRLSAPNGEDAPWRAQLVRRGPHHEHVQADIRFRVADLRNSLIEASDLVRRVTNANGW